jgi:hypothetical protein
MSLFHAGVAQCVEHNPDKVEAAGSNPVPGTARFVQYWIPRPVLDGRVGLAGVAQSVELLLRKQRVAGSTPVSGPVVRQWTTTGTTETVRGAGVIGNTSAPHAEDCGIIPRALHQTCGVTAAAAPTGAGVAQTVERLTCNQRVAGSIPVSGSVAGGGTTTTTGTGTVGQVPERPKGRGCNPRSREPNVPGSNPGLPTGTTAGGRYCERVAEMDRYQSAKLDYAGSNPAALSGRNESRECTRAVVERYNTRLSTGMVGVQIPSALPLKRQAEDTTARAMRACGIGIVAVRQPSKLDYTGSIPVSRSLPGVGMGGTDAREIVPGRIWTGKLDTFGLLAQLVRAPDSKSGDWRFESSAARPTRGSQVVRHRVHTSATVGSIPSPATTSFSVVSRSSVVPA